MQFFKDFMRGRYGADQLGFALILTSLILSFIFRFVQIQYLYLLTYVPLGLAIYRILSRNIPKRGVENIKFLNLRHDLKRRLGSMKNRRTQRGQYLFTKCPHCKQRIRLPRARGTLQVNCPSCNTQFHKKT